MGSNGMIAIAKSLRGASSLSALCLLASLLLLPLVVKLSKDYFGRLARGEFDRARIPRTNGGDEPR